MILLPFMPPLVQFGLIAGIVMGICAIILNISGFTKLNLTEYLGCLLTGHKSGSVSFIAGFTAHLLFSILFAYLYFYSAAYFELPINLQTAFILGAANTLFSGIMIKMFDAISPCIASDKIKAMNFFASGYGCTGVFTYIFVHFVYAVVLFKLLGA